MYKRSEFPARIINVLLCSACRLHRQVGGKGGGVDIIILYTYAFHTLRSVVEVGVRAAAASAGRGAGRGGPRVGVGPSFRPTDETAETAVRLLHNRRPAPPPRRCVGKGYT